MKVLIYLFLLFSFCQFVEAAHPQFKKPSQNQCSYTVTLLETNDPDISDFIGDYIKVKMVNVEKNKYKTLEEGSSGKTSSCVETKIGEILANN